MGKNHYLYLNQDEKEHFSLPEKWVPVHVVESEDGAAPASVREMTLEALSSPTGTQPFQDLLSRARNVAVIVDDATRPTPVAEILDALFSCAAEVGFPREQVTIVVALGTHEAMKKEQLEARLGKAVLSGCKVVQHNAWQSDLVPVTIPGSGKVVKINPEVARADLRVGVSSILPHPMAGYGGGPKIVMPGVCNFEYVRDHHMKYVIHPRTALGATDGNPFHEGVLEAARAIGLDFSINCVYSQKGQAIRIIGGSLEEAFAEAVALCFEKLGHRFEEKVDVTITSAYPHTHGHQIFKAVVAPDTVTKETGAILLFAPVVAGIPGEFLKSFNEVQRKSDHNPTAYVKESLSKGMAFLPDKSIDFNMAMTQVFTRPRIRTILVSPAISRDEATIMGLEYAPSIGEGLKLIEESHPEAKVAIFPAGGLIVPVIAWER